MKVLVQWAKRTPDDLIQTDEVGWASLPTRAVPGPGQLGGSNNQDGWVNHIMVQGLLFNGADHYAVEPVVVGLDAGVKVTTWWDDPDDYPVGERRARVWTILPLAPDPSLGNAINTRQSQMIYAEGPRFAQLEQRPPQNTSVRPWSEFVAPPAAITRHGVWLTDAKYSEHVQRQTPWGWRHWADHLPETETEQDAQGRRVLKAQRDLGRYLVPSRTITYYQRDTNSAVGYVISVHENALSLVAGAGETESVTPNATIINAWNFVTDANQPNFADWPSGNYRVQLDVTVASTGLVYGQGADYGSFVENVNAAVSGVNETVNWATEFSGTGLKLETLAWDPAAFLATDRLGVDLRVKGDSHGDTMTLRFSADAFVDGPWSTQSVVPIIDSHYRRRRGS